ncbi:hypothetical protein MMC17_002600 [Xylographa soralifera]|nr:hypothetical protein [Xylographa soralifera]
MLSWLKVGSHKEIDNWLRASGTDQYYDMCLSARLEGTCDWIFGNSAYLNWVSPDFPLDTAKILWIYGPAGYGKSILCARLIQTLVDTPASSLAWYFCSSDVEARREPLAIVRSWISQLVARNKDAFKLALAQSQKNKARLASQTDIWDLFKSIVSCIPNCIFIMDGLDECTQSGIGIDGNTGRKDLLTKLKESVANTTSRILIISRDEVDIRSGIYSNGAKVTDETIYEYRISEDDVRSDIALFSKSIVDEKLPNKNDVLKGDLAIQMASKCNGMFLWLKLQGQHLRGGKNRKQLEETIGDMPTGLERAYERDWIKISKLNSPDKCRALALLRWVTFASRPLTVFELTEALIIRDDDDCEGLQTDDLPDCVDQEYIDGEIIGLCGSFLEARSANSKESCGDRTVHLVHFSVKEYLFSVMFHTDIPFSDQQFQNNHLAKLCIRYLEYREPYERMNSSRDDLDHCPFLEYAVKSWHLHISPAGKNYQELLRLIDKFFCPGNPNWNFWRIRFEHINQSPSLDSRPTEKEPATPTYYASMFGLVDTINFLQAQGVVELNKIGGRYGTALQAACAKGHTLVVALLTTLGADINLQGGQYGSALNAAAAMGHENIIQILVERKASLSIHDPRGRTSVILACLAGHYRVVRLLLDRGADMAAADIDGWTPLHLAVIYNHVEVVELLLKKGADMAAADIDGWTPLHLAVIYNHVEVVELLLKKGADMAAADKDEMTPIHSAAASGYVEVVKLLLDKGADIVVVDIYGWTPLYLAATRNHVEVVRLFLDKGADMAAANKYGSTPLHLATAQGYVEVVKLLLDKGADITAINNKGQIPLIIATANGHTEVVNLLSEKEAQAAAANKQ